MTHLCWSTFASICLLCLCLPACSGDAAAEPRAIDLLEGTTVAAGALENTGAVQVTVLDVDGNPWAGAVVKAKGYYGLRLKAVTDSNGQALFEQVTKGPTRVMVFENEIRMTQEFLQVREDVTHEVVLRRPVVVVVEPEVDQTEKRPVE